MIGMKLKTERSNREIKYEVSLNHPTTYTKFTCAELIRSCCGADVFHTMRIGMLTGEGDARHCTVYNCAGNRTSPYHSEVPRDTCNVAVAGNLCLLADAAGSESTVVYL
eukprot:767410-Hanusia_phi.AAC.6